MNEHNPRPNWLDEFEELANKQLGDGSSCRQVHPIIEAWYTQLMEGEPPESRASVLQAIACLSTEIILDMPEELNMDEDDTQELSYWIQEILMIGRAFQLALESGELDDL